MNGIDEITKCKPFLPDTVFIAFTADSIRYNKNFWREAGFSLCITKPILPVKFLRLLEEALTLRGQLMED